MNARQRSDADPATAHGAGAEAHQPAGRLPLRPDPAASSSPAPRTTPSSAGTWRGGKKTALAGHKSWVRALAFAAQEKLLFSGDYGRPRPRLAGRRRRRRPPCGPSPAHQGWVRAWRSAPTARRWPRCGNDHLVKLWSVPERQAGRAIRRPRLPRLQRRLPSRRRRSSSPATCKGVVKALGPRRKGTPVRDLDAQRAAQVRHGRSAPTIGGVRSMAFSRDGTLLACAGITDVTQRLCRRRQAGGRPVRLETGQRKQLLRPRTELPGHGLGRRLSTRTAFWRGRRRQRRRAVVLEAGRSAGVPHADAAEQCPRSRPAPRRQAAGRAVLRRRRARLRHDAEGRRLRHPARIHQGGSMASNRSLMAVRASPQSTGLCRTRTTPSASAARGAVS